MCTFEEYSGRQIVSSMPNLTRSMWMRKAPVVSMMHWTIQSFEESRLVDQDTTVHVRSKSLAPCAKDSGHDFLSYF